MKKIISTAVIASIVLSMAAYLPVFAEESASDSIPTVEKLEKIPSLDKMGNFLGIIKKGKELFGVRKETRREEMEKKKAEKKQEIEKKKEEKKASTTARVLEKISTPKEKGEFAEIRKVGNALWGYRKLAKAVAIGRIIKTSEASCVIAAIEVKDQAIIGANSAFTTGLNAAVAERTTCQKNAIGSSTEEQIQALANCVKTFKTAQETLRKASLKAHQEAWAAYNKSLKACTVNNVPVPTPTPTSASTPTSTPETTTNLTTTTPIVVEDGGGNIANLPAAN